MKVEMYNRGALYSLHSSDTKEINLGRAFFLLFPRAFTPVCSAEVDELSKKYTELEGWVCYAGSTDSPEVMQEWRPDANIPLITVAHNNPLLQQFIDPETGYCQRIAVWVEDNKIIHTYREGDDERRPWQRIISQTAELKKR